MASPDCNALLDQLQLQVNLVLEQTGRVFAAVDTTTKKPPTAQVNKLKQILPKVQSNFHQALDELENELRLAQLVLRRDLALCREKSGRQADALVVAQITQHSTESLSDKKIISMDGDAMKNQSGATEDVTMEDSQPEEQSANTAQSKDAMDEAAPISPRETIDTKAAPVTGSEMKEDTAPQDETQTRTAVPDAKTADTSLQIDTAASDTKPNQPTEDEKIPDTAKESISNDLDSLFGGGDNSTNEPSNEFTFDENATGEIDFGDFTNFNTDNGDNDNISSLLPGLEDYANTQSNASGAELNLSSFFNTNTTEQNNAMNQQGAGEQRDTTFDDLMNLATFDGSTMGDEANNTGDVDFESLFN